MLYFFSLFVLNFLRDLLRYRCFGTRKYKYSQAPQPSCTLLPSRPLVGGFVLLSAPSLCSVAPLCCSALRRSAPLCTALHRSAPLCTALRRSAPLCAALRRSAPLCTALMLHYCGTRVCTVVSKMVLCFTSFVICITEFLLYFTKFVLNLYCITVFVLYVCTVWSLWSVEFTPACQSQKESMSLADLIS